MNVRSTSRAAFHSLKDLSNRQYQVFETIQLYGPLSNFDISQKLHMPINSVTPRTGELVEKDMVVESHRAVHPITGKRVIFWKVNPTPKPTIKDQCDELMRGVESFQMSLKGVPDFNQPELDF